MNPWAEYYRQGLRGLARHRPERAVSAFNAAISACPVTQASRLARTLFLTGVTLKKLGAHDEAVRAWSVSQKLNKRGPAFRYLKWFSNEYGMAKQNFAEMDDWRAFFAVQLKKYLGIKKSARIKSTGEEDMIRDLIYEAWTALKSSGNLDKMNSDEKMDAFRSVSIHFPKTSASTELSHEKLKQTI